LAIGTPFSLDDLAVEAGLSLSSPVGRHSRRDERSASGTPRAARLHSGEPSVLNAHRASHETETKKARRHIAAGRRF
jgi:hypothetical protein